MKKSFIELTKKLKVVGVTALLIAGVSTFQSCNREGCTDPTANNFDDKAKDDDGSCTYDRDAFIGTYNATENCQSGTGTFTMTIAASSANTVSILLNNFGDFGQAVTGTVSGTSLTVASQQINVQGTAITISGSGALNGSTLTINYTAAVGGASDSCVITAIKQ
ncbi:MAG: hypothetical protein ACK4GL_12310 [Flavobacteriales bacterium]